MVFYAVSIVKLHRHTHTPWQRHFQILAAYSAQVELLTHSASDMPLGHSLSFQDLFVQFHCAQEHAKF